LVPTLPEDVTVHVTDNASGKEMQDLLVQYDVVVHRNESNEGFIAPHNAVFRALDDSADFFIVLNNDIIVPEGWYELFLKKFEEDDGIAAVGPTALCGRLRDNAQGFNGTPPEYIEGSFLALRVSAVKEVGGLFDDERIFFAYAEDSDLAMRLRERGYKLAHVDVPVEHGHFVTSREVAKVIDLGGIEYRNRLVFKQRWGRYLKRRSFEEKILIRRRGAMGDVLWVSAIAKALKEENPSRIIYADTRCQKVLETCQYVDCLDVPREVDRIIDLNGAYEKTPHLPIWESYAREAQVTLPESTRPNIGISQKVQELVNRVIPKDMKAVAIHPGPTLWPGRDWPLERFVALAAWFRKKGFAVIEVGSARDASIVSEIDLRGRTSPEELAAVLGQCELFVGPDSFPMHVAVAMNTPLVALFGSVKPETRLPNCNKFAPASVDKFTVGCLGCHNILGLEASVTYCFRETPLCMERLQLKQVQQLIEDKFLCRKSHLKLVKT